MKEDSIELWFNSKQIYLRKKSHFYKKQALYTLCVIFDALSSYLNIYREQLKDSWAKIYWSIPLLTSLSWCFTICSSKNSSSSSATRVASHPPASGSSRLSWELKSSAGNKRECRRWGETTQLSYLKTSIQQFMNSHFHLCSLAPYTLPAQEKLTPFQTEPFLYRTVHKNLGVQTQVCLMKFSTGQENPPAVNTPSLPTGIFWALLLN